MPPNHFESEVESFLEGSHGDRTHIKRADHHTVTPLCGTLLFLGGSPFLGDAGSSPLTRGKPVEAELRVADRGLIPAHAGKTQPEGSRKMITRAHPRSRGENTFPAVDAITRAGSSPLTRGKHPVTARGRDLRRLIPAHAGKTGHCSLSPPALRAHPRSRGENDLVAEFLTARPGSSPLTRGKRGQRRRAMGYIRLIPAHAGKTSPPIAPASGARAHPRSRGENCGRP